MLSVIYVECHLCWVSFMLSVIYAECHLSLVSFRLSVIYAECYLCWVSFMLSVGEKLIMQCVLKLRVVAPLVILIRNKFN